ncbi:unnamed protein product [Dovyalis caffra]|uniref:Uncharacterized protein n=1 Tax=Dovyalis caffra TaxID=77055 RepID=A0AAV1RY80_9ROSI|nr:unnamed protein product [Dovyalis caffra]
MGSKNTKLVIKIEDCETFFTFFHPLRIPENKDDLDDDAISSTSSSLSEFSSFVLKENPQLPKVLFSLGLLLSTPLD